MARIKRPTSAASADWAQGGSIWFARMSVIDSCVAPGNRASYGTSHRWSGWVRQNVEGYIAAIVVSGAAFTVPRMRRARLSALLRATVLLLGALAALSIVWAIGLREWLTVTWALGLLASCVAVSTCAFQSLTAIRAANLFSLVLAATALSLSTAALVFPSSSFVLAHDVAHAPYRNDVRFILFGDAVLSLTAIGIALGRLR